MKKWSNAIIEELNLSETEHGFTGIHSDGNRAQGDSNTCQNKGNDYWTVYGTHHAHPDAVVSQS